MSLGLLTGQLCPIHSLHTAAELIGLPVSDDSLAAHATLKIISSKQVMSQCSSAAGLATLWLVHDLQ